MKILIPCDERSATADVAMRFGRAAAFAICTDGSGAEFTYVPNDVSRQAAQGAGIQAAQCAADNGADAVLLRHCGPKAFRVLDAAGVKVFSCPTGDLTAAVKAHAAGELEQLRQPSVEGHWV